jgi:transcriptional regulator of acetoin/glycerol metabolism
MPLIKVNCAAIPRRCSNRSSSVTCAARLHRRDHDEAGQVRARRRRIDLPRRESARSAARIQAKLLRVLQEREFEPLGAERTQKVDVRVIAPPIAI